MAKEVMVTFSASFPIEKLADLIDEGFITMNEVLNDEKKLASVIAQELLEGRNMPFIHNNIAVDEAWVTD